MSDASRPYTTVFREHTEQLLDVRLKYHGSIDSGKSAV